MLVYGRYSGRVGWVELRREPGDRGGGAEAERKNWTWVIQEEEASNLANKSARS